MPLAGGRAGNRERHRGPAVTVGSCGAHPVPSLLLQLLPLLTPQHLQVVSPPHSSLPRHSQIRQQKNVSNWNVYQSPNFSKRRWNPAGGREARVSARHDLSVRAVWVQVGCTARHVDVVLIVQKRHTVPF